MKKSNTTKDSRSENILVLWVYIWLYLLTFHFSFGIFVYKFNKNETFRKKTSKYLKKILGEFPFFLKWWWHYW